MMFVSGVARSSIGFRALVPFVGHAANVFGGSWVLNERIWWIVQRPSRWGWNWIVFRTDNYASLSGVWAETNGALFRYRMSRWRWIARMALMTVLRTLSRGWVRMLMLMIMMMAFLALLRRHSTTRTHAVLTFRSSSVTERRKWRGRYTRVEDSRLEKALPRLTRTVTHLQLFARFLQSLLRRVAHVVALMYVIYIFRHVLHFQN